MADGVPKKVHQRVFQCLEHQTVRAYPGAGQPVINLLVLIPCEIPNHLSKAFKHVFRRREPGGPDVALEPLRSTSQTPGAPLLQQARGSELAGQGPDSPLRRFDMAGGRERPTPRGPPARADSLCDVL